MLLLTSLSLNATDLNGLETVMTYLTTTSTAAWPYFSWGSTGIHEVLLQMSICDSFCFNLQGYKMSPPPQQKTEYSTLSVDETGECLFQQHKMRI